MLHTLQYITICNNRSVLHHSAQEEAKFPDCAGHRVEPSSQPTQRPKLNQNLEMSGKFISACGSVGVFAAVCVCVCISGSAHANICCACHQRKKAKKTPKKIPRQTKRLPQAPARRERGSVIFILNFCIRVAHLLVGKSCFRIQKLTTGACK